MVGRSIPEGTHGNPILGQFPMFGIMPPGCTQTVCRANRLGQVAGDGRGLRRDHQCPGAQHLVAATRSWVFFRTGKTKQHVPDDLLSRHLFGPGDLKRRIAIVQERNVSRAQGMGHSRHPLMTGGADRIEPLPRLLHGTTGPIQRPAEDLRPKQ